MFHFNIKKVSGKGAALILSAFLVCATVLITAESIPSVQSDLPQQTEQVTAHATAQFCRWETPVTLSASVRTGESVQMSVDTLSMKTELENDDSVSEDVQTEDTLEVEDSDFVTTEKSTEEEILIATSEQMDDAPKANFEKMESDTPVCSGYSEAALNGAFTEEEAALMIDLGCTPDKEGEKLLLAKAISGEAGPNKLDQLMVGAVIINRLKSDEFAYADTIIDVLSAPKQYAVYPDCIRNSEPSEEILSTAEQLLEGKFSIPSNIVFQAAFSQGTSGGMYLYVNNKNQHPGFYNTCYCYNNELSTVDCFGRPSLTADQAIAQAKVLHEEDVAKGICTSSVTP